MAPPENFLVSSFKDLYDTRDQEGNCDFSIVCQSGEEVIKVHSFVLCARSKVLMKAVTGDFKEGNSMTIELNQYSHESMNEFIKFLYGVDELAINYSHGIAEKVDKKKFRLALDLLEMASVYDVQDLHLYVASVLNAWMPSEEEGLQPFIEVFEIALMHKMKKLVDECLALMLYRYGGDDLHILKPIFDRFPKLAHSYANKIAVKSTSVATFKTTPTGSTLHVPFYEFPNIVSISFKCDTLINVTGFDVFVSRFDRVELTVDVEAYKANDTTDLVVKKRLMDKKDSKFTSRDKSSGPWGDAADTAYIPLDQPLVLNDSWRGSHLYQFTFQVQGKGGSRGYTHGCYPIEYGFTPSVDEDSFRLEIPEKTLPGKDGKGNLIKEVKLTDIVKGGMLWTPVPAIHFHVL